MMTLYSAFTFALTGAIFGSFAGAQVWRLRARQLREDKQEGEKIDAREYKRLSPLIVKASQDRSRCLSCGHTLVWYDLVPVISWVSTGGKCRYCKKPIGWFELFMEVGFAVFFVLSYISFAPELGTLLGMARLAIWLAAGVLMGILLAYDAKWFLLPEKINITLGIFGAIFAALTLAGQGISGSALLSLVGSLAIMSGLYLVIYVISRGAWIGFGDVILGIGLGFLLIDWEKAFLALFLANLLGLIAVAPAYIQRKVTGKTHIPFGPFLIVATILVVLYGDVMMSTASTIIERLTSLVLYPLML